MRIKHTNPPHTHTRDVTERVKKNLPGVWQSAFNGV